MIVVLIGTRAQMIKMAPVLLALERQSTPYRLVLSGQHQATMPELMHEFGIATAPIRLYDGREITGIVQMGLWWLRLLWRGLVTERAAFQCPPRGRHCVVIHGDTFSTLLGAVLGRLRTLDVVHIEAGLSSGRWCEPFPEELTRRLVFRLSDLAFCPGAWATRNMRPFRARSIDTGANTIVDAVYEATQRPAIGSPPPAEAYAVVSLHRFENIFKAARFSFIVAELERMAQSVSLVFVLHPATQKQAEKFGLLERLARNPRIRLSPRMTYVPFVQLLVQARFVVSDGGSNQEELACLGIPTLLMRDTTERQDGIGDTAVLSHYDSAVIERFVRDCLARPAEAPRQVTVQRPSAHIARELAAIYAN